MAVRSTHLAIELAGRLLKSAALTAADFAPGLTLRTMRFVARTTLFATDLAIAISSSSSGTSPRR